MGFRDCLLSAVEQGAITREEASELTATYASIRPQHLRRG